MSNINTFFVSVTSVVSWSVGDSVIISNESGKLQFHAPFEALFTLAALFGEGLAPFFFLD